MRHASLCLHLGVGGEQRSELLAQRLHREREDVLRLCKEPIVKEPAVHQRASTARRQRARPASEAEAEADGPAAAIAPSAERPRASREAASCCSWTSVRLPRRSS